MKNDVPVGLEDRCNRQTFFLTTDATMYNPKPVPVSSGLVEKKGENILSLISFGIPGPLSVTSMQAKVLFL